MQYLSSDICFAANAVHKRILLNDIARYSIPIKPVTRIRGKNRYSLSSVGRAYLMGSLSRLNIPTSSMNDLFSRIDWNSYEHAVDQLQTGEIEHLIVIFLSFEPDEDFSGICTNPSELSEIFTELGHYVAIDCGEFLRGKLEGWI